MLTIALSLLRVAFLSAAFSAAALAVEPPTGIGRDTSSPAGLDTGEANLHAAPDGTLHLTWCGPGPTPALASTATDAGTSPRALLHATLAPAATAWSAPHVVVSTSLLMENWADFPSLTVGTDGALTAQWFQALPPPVGGAPEPHGHAYSGWLARSTDGGASWSEPMPLGHEFVSLAPLSGGRVLTVWLESLRSAAAHHDVAHAAHGTDEPSASAPAMRLQSRLLAADGRTLGEWTVDGDVCTCCQTTLTVLPGDRAFVAYRGHTPDEIRDHSYALFADGAWSAPRLLHADGWQIAACPVNGPAADARADTLAVAWFTVADGSPRVRAKLSADQGHNFGAAVPINHGRPAGRVEVVALPDASAVILWLELASGAQPAGLYARRLFPDGALSPARLVASGSVARAAGFPRAALRADGQMWVVATAVSDGPPRVRLLTLDPAALTVSADSTR